jgi:hypothetical protein
MYYLERNRINDHNVYKMTIDEVNIEKIEYATKSFLTGYRITKRKEITVNLYHGLSVQISRFDTKIVNFSASFKGRERK